MLMKGEPIPQPRFPGKVDDNFCRMVRERNAAFDRQYVERLRARASELHPLEARYPFKPA